MERVKVDVAIAGAGIAGLSAALKLAPLRVAVVTKSTFGQGGATAWAQGGIAAALGSDDSPALHSIDTRVAGAGLSSEKIVDILTRDAPTRIEELQAMGAQFDRDDSGALQLGREGAHRRRRIVHAGGDATGREILKTLSDAVRAAQHIQIFEHTTVRELVLDDAGICGLLAERDGVGIQIGAPCVILATGSVGQLFSRTTNPVESTGDGLALAARAGALLADLEFVQFHPTAIDCGKDPMPLASEALRGEGAILRDEDGTRFVDELASRDVVARAVFELLQSGKRVFLDATHFEPEKLPIAFPTIFASCIEAGIDPRNAPIPVAPAAHYFMGGVAVDDWGRSSIAGLWACGEISATGVHGANRLASNSLLEALVYGHRVAEDVAASMRVHRDAPQMPLQRSLSVETNAVSKLRTLMYNHVGVIRNAGGLQHALDEIAGIQQTLLPRSALLDTLLTNGELIARAALARAESRGSHYRSDFPVTQPAFAKRAFISA